MRQHPSGRSEGRFVQVAVVAMCALAIQTTGCSVRQFATGLPPDVTVSQVAGAMAQCRVLAVAVDVPHPIDPARRESLIGMVGDVARQTLLAKGYKVLVSAKTPFHPDASGTAHAVLTVTVNEISTSVSYDAAGVTTTRIRFAVSAKAVRAGDGQVLWTAHTADEAVPHRDASVFPVLVEVVQAVLETLPVLPRGESNQAP